MKRHKSLTIMKICLLLALSLYIIDYFISIPFQLFLFINALIWFVIGWNIAEYRKFIDNKIEKI